MASIKSRHLLILAGIAYLLAWPLPSVVETIPVPLGPTVEVVRGWEATRWALSPVWPDRRSLEVGPLHAAVIVASALANLVFLGALLLALRWPKRITRVLEYATWIAVLLAAHWLLFFRPELKSLRIGYYLWLTSFVLLALGVHGVRGLHLRGSATGPVA